MFSIAFTLAAFAPGCGNDQTTSAGGAGGSSAGGSGGSTGAAAGSGGSGGSSATAGAAGRAGAAGSDATGGGSGSGGTAGSGAAGGSAGSGGTGGNGGTAGKGGAPDSGATGGMAGSGGAAGGSAGSTGSGVDGGSVDGGRPDGGSADSGNADSANSDGGTADPLMNFFVTSDTSVTGNLGGLAGADARCQRLATVVGGGSKTWRAYLSIEAADGGAAVNAKDRIGAGPYYNSRGAMLAADAAALHARSGDANLFLTETGAKVNGQWAGSPTPIQHDVLTGSMADGTVLVGQTCLNWTSAAMANTAQIGHSDGLGPGMSTTPPTNSWNSAHANGGCNNTAPLGGAGRLYCFVGP